MSCVYSFHANARTQGTFVATVGVLCAVVSRYYPDRVSLYIHTHHNTALLTFYSHQQREHSRTVWRRSSVVLSHEVPANQMMTGLLLTARELSIAKCIYSNPFCTAERSSNSDPKITHMPIAFLIFKPWKALLLVTSTRTCQPSPHQLTKRSSRPQTLATRDRTHSLVDRA